jgi:Flp pilus assembly secretin CpaC
MEVDVTDSIDLGFSGLVRITSSGNQYVVGSLTDSVLTTDADEDPDDDEIGGVLDNLISALADNPANFVAAGAVETGSTLIQGLIRASATVNGTNILSAPHILTLDNEEAEIKVGDNIPIISSRVQSAAGITTADVGDNDNNSLATSQNIERQDIGITLRVTPQISEGDTLRLEIFQEVTAVNEGLTETTGSADQVGVALSNRKIENVVTVADEETVVIGGLIDEAQGDKESKVPWLGDIPVLGWLFKSTNDSIQKRNLLVFLTPHIIRNKAQHAQQTIRKREEFWASSDAGAALSDSERAASDQRIEEDRAAGIPLEGLGETNPVRARLEGHRTRYPVEQMRDLEAGDARRTVGQRPRGVSRRLPTLGRARRHLRRRVGRRHRPRAADRCRVRRHARERRPPRHAALRAAPRPLPRPGRGRAYGGSRARVLPLRTDPLPGGFERVSSATPQLEHLGLREVLLRATRLSLQQLDEAVRKQQASGGRLVDHILELGFLDEEEILHALGAQLGLPVRRELSPDDRHRAARASADLLRQGERGAASTPGGRGQHPDRHAQRARHHGLR